MKWTCAPRAAEMSVVKRRRPEATLRESTSSKPGSKNGAVPAARALIRPSSTSMPTTSCPISAIDAAWTAPR